MHLKIFTWRPLHASEISIMSGVHGRLAPYFHIQHSPVLLGMAATSMTFGAIVGTVGAGFSQDLVGRKMSLVFACAVYITGAVITCTSQVLIASTCSSALADPACMALPFHWRCAHAHTHAHTCTRTHTHTHAHAHTHAHVHTRTHTRTHAHTRTDTRTHTHTCTCVCPSLPWHQCLRFRPIVLQPHRCLGCW